MASCHLLWPKKKLLKKKNESVRFRWGIIVVIPVLSRDRLEPCRLGGLEPARLAGREFGFDPLRDPPGVSPVRFGVYDGLRGV